MTKKDHFKQKLLLSPQVTKIIFKIYICFLCLEHQVVFMVAYFSWFIFDSNLFMMHIYYSKCQLPEDGEYLPQRPQILLGILVNICCTCLLLSEIFKNSKMGATHCKYINKMQEQEERKFKLYRFCNSFAQNHPKRSPYLAHHIYSDKRKVIYCYVPKVACTNWKRIMYQFEKGINATILMDRQTVQKPGFKGISYASRYKLKRKYYTFLFVRHPFERLVSAYRNKFVQPFPDDLRFQKEVGVKIIQKYRKNSTTTNDTYTFTEFVQFVIDKAAREGSHKLNEHWQPQSDLCSIYCARFDFIGKYEALVEDSRIILKNVNASNSFVFPENRTDNYKTKTSEIYKKYMKALPKEYLIKLYNKYENDFDAFGYEIPDFEIKNQFSWLW